MKAIVTIFDDNGKIIEKDRVLDPYDTDINTHTMMNSDGILNHNVLVKTTYFKFQISECEREKKG